MTMQGGRAQSASSWINPDDAHKLSGINRRPFDFRHNLARLPIFTLDEVLALSERLPDQGGFKAWQNGDAGIDGGWNARPAEVLPLDVTLKNIAETDSVVVLKHVEQDPVFGPALQELLQETFALAPQEFQDDVVIGECLIFINSPRRKTVYHFDLEPSFLLQVQGEKVVHAWDRDDRSLVPEAELEAYCGAGDLSAAIYKPERQKDAHTFRLTPGVGVHFPSTGPHWVQSGDDVAISVNVNFDLRSLHHGLKYVYAVNHRMRRLGLNPIDPGVRPWADDLKAGLWTAARRGKKLARSMTGRLRAGEDYPVWQPQR